MTRAAGLFNGAEAVKRRLHGDALICKDVTYDQPSVTEQSAFTLIPEEYYGAIIRV